MSCDREVPGDYELSEVVEAAEANRNGIAEEDGLIMIDGPTLSCYANRLEPGTDLVEVLLLIGETAADCQEFIDRLAAAQN